MKSEVIVKRDEHIHLRCNSGLRLRADDPRLESAQHAVRPFAVVESDAGYAPLAADVELTIASQGGAAVIRAEALEIMPLSATIDEAVDAYLKRHPLPQTAGRANCLRRAITLDMWLPDGRRTSL